jgi:cytochrome c oxidase subunit II
MGAGYRRGVKAALLLGVVGLLSAACGVSPQTTIDPQGPNARMIFDLFNIWIFWPAVVVFFAVEAVLIYAAFRYRGREGDPLPVQTHGNTPLEITWTIIPALILIVILYFTFQTQAALATAPESRDAVNVRVIGHQWWWEFQYPDLGVTTANELHIPTGVPVNVTLESADVIHSFWVPLLAGKQDAIPGRVNRIWMQADKDGTYFAQCAEFCGVQHALMRFLVVAESPNTFNSWATNERRIQGFGSAAVPTPAPGAQPSLVQQGATLFANGACVTCHTVRGTQAAGTVGPELTHFGARNSIAANTLPKDPEGNNLKRWLRNPQAVKPGALMPNLNLSEADIEAIAAYLESLD